MTKPVPPPVPGNVKQTVPTRSVKVLPKVPLHDTVAAKPKVLVSIVRITAVNAESHVPGEVNGPAVQVTVGIKNNLSKPLDVTYAAVSAYGSDGSPGDTVTTSSSQPFSGSVQPGATASGTYVFRIPVAKRDPVTVTVSYTGAGPVVQFTGAVK